MDLTGRLLRHAIEDEDGESLFPGFWPIEELKRTKATLQTARWMAKAPGLSGLEDEGRRDARSVAARLPADREQGHRPNR
jgi:hypothetical protein